MWSQVYLTPRFKYTYLITSCRFILDMSRASRFHASSGKIPRNWTMSVPPGLACQFLCLTETNKRTKDIMKHWQSCEVFAPFSQCNFTSHFGPRRRMPNILSRRKIQNQNPPKNYSSPSTSSNCMHIRISLPLSGLRNDGFEKPRLFVLRNQG